MTTTRELAIATGALDISDPHRPVSSRSRFCDDRWNLDTTRPGVSEAGVQIYWPADVPEAIVHEFKALAWSLLVDPQGRKASNVASLADVADCCRVLGRWMISERTQYDSLAEITPTAIGFLLHNLGEMVREIDEASYDDFDPDEGRGEFDGPGETPPHNGNLSFSLVYAVFLVIAANYRQRRALEKMGVAPMKEDPLSGRSPYDLANSVRPQSPSSVEALHDEIALPIMIAVDRLLPLMDDVCRLQNIYLSALREHGKTERGKALANAALCEFVFTTPTGETVPWHPQLPLRHDDGSPQLPSVSLSNLIRTARDVCVLTLIFATGIRISEIVPLADGLEEDGLPSCVSREPSPSRDLDLFYAHSRVSKGRSVPDPDRWLIGAVPRGSGGLPISVQAILILERLFRPWRSLSRDAVANRSLIVSFRTSHMPDQPRGVGRITTHRLSRSIKNLYAVLADWKALESKSRSKKALARYFASSGTCIKLWQWRKTFAVNHVRVNSTLTHAIRRHFKQLHMATTQGAYIGNDPSLIEEFDDASMMASVRFIRERATGNSTTVGTAGRLLARSLERLRHIDEHGDPLTGNLVDTLRLAGLPLFFAAHGACAIGIAPQKARCHKVAGNVTFLNRQPDFSRRTPELCASCACFAADDTNLPYWRERLHVANRARRRLAASGQSAASLALEHRARVAARMCLSLRRGLAELSAAAA